MAWTPLLLVLLSHCTGSLSQPVLTQPPSLSASLGSSARLTCTLSTGFSVGSYSIRWYQQKPGSPPWYLLRFKSDSDKHQGSGVPSRFSGSKDASANTGILHISGLQPEDEADYYCNIWDDSSKTYTVIETHREVRQKSVPVLAWCCHPLLVALTKSTSGGGFCCQIFYQYLIFLGQINLTMLYPAVEFNFSIDPLLKFPHPVHVV
uniref:Ig-like domain-containing protein n=1 Tax=Prolemur simus TaxID=1328070 RepID=A0A8C8ZT76_PROSS